MDKILFEQQEAIHSIFNYLIENGHNNKIIKVHPRTYEKWIRRCDWQLYYADDITFQEASTEEVVKQHIYGYLSYQHSWEIPVTVTTEITVNQFQVQWILPEDTTFLRKIL
jgi:hypothetical protein